MYSAVGNPKINYLEPVELTTGERETFITFNNTNQASIRLFIGKVTYNLKRTHSQGIGRPWRETPLILYDLF